MVVSIEVLNCRINLCFLLGTKQTSVSSDLTIVTQRVGVSMMVISTKVSDHISNSRSPFGEIKTSVPFVLSKVTQKLPMRVGESMIVVFAEVFDILSDGRLSNLNQISLTSGQVVTNPQFLMTSPPTRAPQLTKVGRNLMSESALVDEAGEGLFRPFMSLVLTGQRKRWDYL